MAESRSPRRGLRRPAQPNQTALFASAARIDISNKNSTKDGVHKIQPWQQDAFRYRKDLGEVHYATSFIGNCGSKIKLFVAEIPDDPTEKPKPTKDPVAIEALQRISDTTGGHSKLLRRQFIQFTIPGECYLVGLMPDPAHGRVNECWEIRSISETEVTADGTVFIRKSMATGSQKKIKLRPQDFIARMWIEDPEFADEADSPMRGILSSCAELLIVEKAFRAHGKSRIPNAKLLVFPKEWSPGIDDETKEEGSEGEEAQDDPLNEALLESFTAPYEQEDSVAQFAPFILRYPIDATKNIDDLIKVVDLSAHPDERLEAQAERAQRRIAQGLPIPVEYVFGLGSANHWGAGQIEDSAFREHLEPLALVSVQALTYAYLTPELVRLKHPDPGKFIIWYDPSELIVHPDKHKNANFGYKERAIGGKAWRKTNNYTEDDAWDEAVDGPKTPINQSQGSPRAPENAPTNPSPAGDGSEPDDSSATASGSVHPTVGLGHRLAEIDSYLMQDLHASIDSAVGRALERAEARILSRAQKDESTKGAVKGAPRGKVAMTLGPAIVKSMGLDARALVMGEFDGIAARFRRGARSAWAASLNLAFPNSIPSEVFSEVDKWVELSALWLEDILQVEAQKLLFKNPSHSKDGERDDARVPFRIARQAVAQAGGGEPDDRWLTRGIGTSLKMREVLVAAGVEVTDAWIWHSPLATIPYKPHLKLNMKKFHGWHDIRLRHDNKEIYPGDNEGCRCQAIPVIGQGS